jgi:hypothetical protein
MEGSRAFPVRVLCDGLASYGRLLTHIVQNQSVEILGEYALAVSLLGLLVVIFMIYSMMVV